MEKGKQKAPAQFVHMPDGSVKVVSAKDTSKQDIQQPTKTKNRFNLRRFKLPNRKHQKQQTSRQDTSQTSQINISVTVPKIKLTNIIQKIPKPNRKQLYVGIPIIIVLVAVGIFFVNKPEKTQKPSTKVLGQNISQKPDFKWILPEASVDKIAGGQVNYDPQKKAVLYTDIIDGITVGVTQQALPATFKDNVKEKMAEYAKKINCTSQIEVEDVMAYAGLSTKGPQTVVFTKKGLLVSIVADKEIPPQSWGTYIASLK